MKSLRLLTVLLFASFFHVICNAGIIDRNERFGSERRKREEFFYIPNRSAVVCNSVCKAEKEYTIEELQAMLHSAAPQKPKTNTEARKLVSIAYVNVYYGEAYQYNGMWQVKGEEFATTPSNETIVAIWSRDSAITH
ncbi:hypothetical protein [Candidatus Azobacteroides pseudotrichonymphae]|uniref:Uncharacterized protein n=1 Tax=Azobacteroides pseudotrichonymphae genomovar. CFP2 TaxID=511995 RepID=B6YS75_AZOPC|nr:hypothetical protein [Candidatus Azobacteroides pseudotrichonymphae]BAG84047.1 hypothetical protein CFPG_P1-26 [Candidatus Azobacteroides pseudotrichonymphae genomovar. CFP2]